MMLNTLIQFSENLAAAIRASGHAATVKKTHFAQELIVDGVPLLVQYSSSGHRFQVKYASGKKNKSGTAAAMDLLHQLFSPMTLDHLKVA